jgi:hypothetical protein
MIARECYGRGPGVGRDLGVGCDLGVGVGLGVAVGDGAGPDWAQYLPPVSKWPDLLSPPQTII